MFILAILPLIALGFDQSVETEAIKKPQYPHAYSPHCSQYISYVTSWKNLTKYQHISCPVIISFIFMTCVFEQPVIL